MLLVDDDRAIMPVRDGRRVCDGIIVMILTVTGTGGCAKGR